MKRTGYHTHRCTCGTLLTCGDDRCAADSSPWLCHACQMLATEDYINDLQAKLLAEKEQQPREHQQRVSE